MGYLSPSVAKRSEKHFSDLFYFLLFLCQYLAWSSTIFVINSLFIWLYHKKSLSLHPKTNQPLLLWKLTLKQSNQNNQMILKSLSINQMKLFRLKSNSTKTLYGSRRLRWQNFSKQQNKMSACTSTTYSRKVSLSLNWLSRIP